MSKLVLIDGNAILHRAYHALPPLTTKKGEPINAVYGFVSILLRVIADLKPTHIAVAFDRKEPTFREKEYKEYQAHRPEADKELISQFAKARQVVKSFNIPFYEKKGYEADDVIGTIARQAVGRQTSDISRKSKTEVCGPKSVDQVVIVTGDKDILQLVNDKVKVYLPKRGLGDAMLMGEKEVVEKMGVKASQIVDYKALVGDPSDNYKGVPGIGPKTAEDLIRRFKSIDQIYKNLDRVNPKLREKLEKGRESAYLSLRLARIVTDVELKTDLENAEKWEVDSQQVLDLFSQYGFKTLTKRVKEVGKRLAFENQTRLF